MEEKKIDLDNEKTKNSQFLKEESDEISNDVDGDNDSDSCDNDLSYEDLLEEVESLKDRLMRALAESENMRKRAERDRKDAEMYGGTKLARDLLSVYDNMARAMDNINEELRKISGPLVDGLELTQREMLDVFSKHKIEKIKPAEGERFDPKFHQAMFEAPVPGTQKGNIIQVMTEGFKIGDRLLRASQVGVSSYEDNNLVSEKVGAPVEDDHTEK